MTNRRELVTAAETGSPRVCRLVDLDRAKPSASAWQSAQPATPRTRAEAFVRAWRQRLPAHPTAGRLVSATDGQRRNRPTGAGQRNSCPSTGRSRRAADTQHSLQPSTRRGIDRPPRRKDQASWSALGHDLDYLRFGALGIRSDAKSRLHEPWLDFERNWRTTMHLETNRDAVRRIACRTSLQSTPGDGGLPDRPLGAAGGSGNPGCCGSPRSPVLVFAGAIGLP